MGRGGLRYTQLYCVHKPVCQKTIARRRREGGGRDIERRGILGEKGAGENRGGSKVGRGG